MTIALQAIYNQLVSLDPKIRRVALTPVADLGVKIGWGDWHDCLYAVMAKAVADYQGKPSQMWGSLIVARLLGLPHGKIWFRMWDQTNDPQRLQLRQAIKAFLDGEAKKALTQEIEAMGDPLATKKEKGSPKTRQKVLVG